MSEHVILSVELDRDFVSRGQLNQSVCARLVLQTSDTFASKLPKSDCRVLLLLDSSSSMRTSFGKHHGASKREGVIQAVRSMVKELQPNDKVSVTFFDSRAYPIIQDVKGSRRQEIVKAVEQIEQYTGATNFEAAFEAATQWAQTANTERCSQRIVFLTDGNPTVGSWERALKLNEDLSKAGVTIDCLGVGDDFAFERMQACSGPSGGTTHLLETPQQATREFRRILKNAQRSLVHDVLLRLQIPPERRDVEIYQVVPEIRYQAPAPDQNGWIHHQIRIGDLNHHQVASLLVYLRMDIHEALTPQELFHCRLDYSIPLLHIASASHEESVRLNLTDGTRHEQRDTSVTTEYVEASLARDEQAFRACYHSDWKRAVGILGQMVHKAQRAGLLEKAQTYKQAETQLAQQHQLDQEQINRLFAQTSRSTRAKTQPYRATKAPIF